MIRPVGVVTGATGGIGRWIARGLAEAGYHVVLMGRDPGRLQSVQDWLAGEIPGAKTDAVLADLRLLQDTRRAGRTVAAAHPRVRILVNNAGMFTARHEVTAEGHEAVLAVNHLAPYVLADALEAALRADGAARIVNIGSSSSDRAAIDPGNLELTRRWGYVRAYSQSKLASLMTSFVRAERLRGTGVVCNVVHPGLVATGLIRERGPIGLAWRLMRPLKLTERQGADTPLHVALSPDWAVRTGLYAKKRVPAAPNPRALDAALVARVEAETQALIARTPGWD